MLKLADRVRRGGWGWTIRAVRVRVRDRYRLVERIALGGSAEVWRAHDDRLDRPVAVKLLHGHLLPDERSRERLEAEARRAAGLNHPGIATVYDVAVEGERPAVVLELVDGESLAVRLEREGRMHPRDAARMALEISRALMHAHEHGVVHRDVKPGNILLDRDGQARLIDFGIARSLPDAADGLTLTGTMVGTLRYMAPEQLTDGTIDERSDVYAVGAVLHEALSGAPPVRAASPVAHVKRQRKGPPSLSGVDPVLAGIVASALSFHPRRRPATAGDLADALQDWLDGRAVARTRSLVTSVAAYWRRLHPGASPRMLLSGVLGVWAVALLVMSAVALQPDDRSAVALDASPSAEPTSAPPQVSVEALPGFAEPVSTLAPTAAPTVAPTAAPDVAPTAAPVAAPTPLPTAAPTPEPVTVAAVTNPGHSEMIRPVVRLLEDYHRHCGEDAPVPDGLASMTKKEAEAILKPRIKECKDVEDA